VLIHGNYLSQEDIDICLAYDLASLAKHKQYASIRQLHDALIAGYEIDDRRDVS